MKDIWWMDGSVNKSLKVSGHVCVVDSSRQIQTQPHTGTSGAAGQRHGANALTAGTFSPQVKEEMNQLETLQKALMNPTPCLNRAGELLIKLPESHFSIFFFYLSKVYGLWLVAFDIAFGTWLRAQSSQSTPSVQLVLPTYLWRTWSPLCSSD